MKQISGRAIFLSLLFVILVAGAVKIFATASDNVTGYGWSPNIGWLSMNNCQGGTCGSQGYGVSIMPTAPGTVSGYAWSPNIGWISFNDMGCPPNVSGCSGGVSIDWANPNSDGTVNLKGWARACSVLTSGCSGTGSYVDNSRRGDWDGFIALNGSTWGGRLNPTTGVMTGYAWGSDVIGWMSLAGMQINLPPPQPVVVTLASADACIPAGQKGRFTWDVTPHSATSRYNTGGGAGPNIGGCDIIKGTKADPICDKTTSGSGTGGSPGTYQYTDHTQANSSVGSLCPDEFDVPSTALLANGRHNFQSSVFTTISGTTYYETTLTPVVGDSEPYILRCYDVVNQTQYDSPQVFVSQCAAPVADFTITATPNSQRLVDGTGTNAGKKIATFTVNVNPTGSFGASGDSVALAVQSYPTMPTSTTFTFTPSTVTSNGTSFGTATLTVVINANEVTTASYTPIVISGTSTPGVRTTNVTVGGKGKKQTIFEEI